MLIEDLGEAFISVKSKGYATSEEVVAVYTLYTQQYLKNYGVDVPPEIATILASSLLSEIAFPPVSDLSSQIDTFFKSLQ